VRPACTFLIPIYNGASYIPRLMREVKAMSIERDEILIIDDGSTDYTEPQWSLLESSDNRIRIIRRNHEGIVSSLNVGLREAGHQYVARVDADDSYSESRIEKQMQLMLATPRCGVVFSDYKFASKNVEKNLGNIYSALNPQSSILSLANPQRMPHPAALLLKSAALNVGGYKDEDSPCEDFGLWLRMAHEYTIASVPELLLTYTINPKGLTAEFSEEMRVKVKSLQRNNWSLFSDGLSSDEIMNEYFSYELVNHTNERKLLLARDLVTLSRRGLRILSKNAFKRILIDLSINFWPNLKIVFRFWTEQRRRRFIRG
jgi:glycosyltransferase involved in cell wall biosynthesis